MANLETRKTEWMVLVPFLVLAVICSWIYVASETGANVGASTAASAVADPCETRAFAFMTGQQKGYDTSTLWNVGSKPKTLFDVRQFEYLNHGPVTGKGSKTYYSFRVDSSTRGGFPIKARWLVVTQHGANVLGHPDCGIVDVVQDN